MSLQLHTRMAKPIKRLSGELDTSLGSISMGDALKDIHLASRLQNTVLLTAKGSQSATATSTTSPLMTLNSHSEKKTVN